MTTSKSTMIEFRAKLITARKWVFGSYIAPFANDGIGGMALPGDNRYIVDPSTVGQYTGLRDCKGDKIFAGDVVRFGDDIYQIVFADACFWINDPHNHYSMELHTTIGMGPGDILGQCGVEVIGNIHDDPNLLKANDG